MYVCNLLLHHLWQSVGKVPGSNEFYDYYNLSNVRGNDRVMDIDLRG